MSAPGRIANAPELTDIRRAHALLKFCVPGAIDLDGVNSVFEEISADGRSGQCLLALAVLAHGHAPNLRTPEALRALQHTTEQLRLEEMKLEGTNHEQ